MVITTNLGEQMKRKFLTLLICFAIMATGVLSIAIYALTDTNIYISSQEALISAIENASENANIVLKRDIELSQELDVSTTLNINLNGKTISATENIWDTTTKQWSIFSVRGGGNLTISGNGKIDASEGGCYAIDVREGATCTIESGTFVGNCSALYVLEGEAIINGGTFELNEASNTYNYAYLLNCKDANLKSGAAKISVTGGSFKNLNPANSRSENPLYNFVAEGYQSVLDGEYYIVSKIA